MNRLTLMTVGLFLMGTCAIAQSAEAGRNFLESLSGELAEKAKFNFEDDGERKDWSNLPAPMHPRNGAKFGEMNDAQKIAAYRLLEAGLSSQGYAKAAGVMRLDDVWAELMNAQRPGQASALFGSDKYWMAIFGTPDTKGVWGWQLDGHHLGVNFTSVNGELSLAPMFFGAEPDTVPSGPSAGWRIFGAERNKGFALLRSLNSEQRGKAVLSETIPEGILEGPGAGGAIKKMEGIRASELDASQRTLLWDLINEYLDNAPRKPAEAQRSKIVADGDANLHFAWMGPIDEEANVYFRVHGPSVLIEYENVFAGPRRGGYSNHIHTILREPSNDYGEDLLRKHYAESEHHR